MVPSSLEPSRRPLQSQPRIQSILCTRSQLHPSRTVRKGSPQQGRKAIKEKRSSRRASPGLRQWSLLAGVLGNGSTSYHIWQYLFSCLVNLYLVFSMLHYLVFSMLHYLLSCAVQIISIIPRANSLRLDEATELLELLHAS